MNKADTSECRICRDESPPLLRPCRCASVVHVVCLKRWVASRVSAHFPLTFSPSNPSCEVCLAPYAAENTADTSSMARAGNKGSLFADSGPHRMFGVRLSICESDPLALLPRPAICDQLVSLESCLLLCLTALAVSGHTIFLVHMRAHVSINEYPRERVLLAGLNAVLSACILFLVQKIVSRWLREGPHSFLSGAADGNSDIENPSSFSTVYSGASPGMPTDVTDAGDLDVVLPVETSAMLSEDGLASRDSEDLALQSQQPRRFSNVSRTSVGHFVLGAFLSVAASAEVYLLLSVL
jgi:hypothetical protein